MYSEIVQLALSILGIVFLLMIFVKHITSSRTENFTLTVPLYGCDRTIFNRIYNIRSALDFCGMKNKCTVVIVNYGAPEFFCKEILSFYEKYDLIKLINSQDIQSELF